MAYRSLRHLHLARIIIFHGLDIVHTLNGYILIAARSLSYSNHCYRPLKS